MQNRAIFRNREKSKGGSQQIQTQKQTLLLPLPLQVKSDLSIIYSFLWSERMIGGTLSRAQFGKNLIFKIPKYRCCLQQ